MLREYVAWFVLLAPILVILGDFLLWLLDDYSTITCVIRGWAARSPWPEVVYLIGATLLYLHFFYNVPERFWEK